MLASACKPRHGVMNLNFASKPFSTFELVAGCAALAVVALIALFGLQVPQSQNPLPAVPSNLPVDPVLLPQAVGQAFSERFSEPSPNAGVARVPPPVDAGSAGDELIPPEPASPRTRSSATPDRPLVTAMFGRWQADDAADTRQRPSITPSSPPEQSRSSQHSGGEDAFVGGWADDTDECRLYQNHGAPLVISAHVAKTASGKCDFRSVKRETASRWRIVAQCSSEAESWTAHVDLTLAGSNLTWSSERGIAIYVRCRRP